MAATQSAFSSTASRWDELPPEVLPGERYVGLVAGGDLTPGHRACDVTIVVVTHESSDCIRDCLDSLDALTDRASFEVIVVDNASHDGTADLVERCYPHVRVIRKTRRSGFATNSNIGIVAAAGRHILLLNPDTCVHSGAVDGVVSHLDQNPAVGAVGPRLVYPDGRPQASARRFPTPMTTLIRRTPLRRVLVTNGVRRHADPGAVSPGVTAVDWLLGAAIALRRTALRDVGGLDDGYRLYCEDIDLCWRLHEMGWRVELLPDVTVAHALGELTSKRFFTVRTVWHFRSMLRFVRLHGVPGRPRVAAVHRLPGPGRQPALRLEAAAG